MNKRLIDLYNEIGDKAFHKEMMKRAYKVRRDGGGYKHITVVEGDELSVVQFKGTTLKMITGNKETYYFNR